MTDTNVSIKKSPIKKETCSVSGCGVVCRLRRGFCPKHYERFKKYGCPNKITRAERGEPLRWLLDHVSYAGDECLTWPFGLKGNGYGALGRDWAHRRMCIEAHGKPPREGLDEVAHSCGRGHEACVNPRHLRWDSRSGNQRDRLLHGTDSRGEKCGISVLKEHEVREIKSLFRLETQVSLAKRFGVDRSTIRAIHSGKSWSWMDW